LVASAKTSTAGAGYHQHVCDLLYDLGKVLDVSWDPPASDGDTGDETGYFLTRDRNVLENEMMVWLRQVAGICLEQIAQGYTSPMLSMPIGHTYPQHKGVVTPMGVRDESWLRKVASDPRNGLDVFPWWSDGINAGFFRGRALYRMWTNVCWRTPVSDHEAARLRQIHQDLEEAHKRDPSLSLPWREWIEIIEFAGSDPYAEFVPDEELVRDIQGRTNERSREPDIGYRRLPVRSYLTGGWSIEIPGIMAEKWEEDGRTWSAWDGHRTVWFTSFSYSRGKEAVPSADETLGYASIKQGDRIEFRHNSLKGCAVWLPYEEEGKALWNLQAFAAAPGALALCNFYLEDEADQDWAIGIWHTLLHSGSQRDS
jgi:hypothetical protein